MNEALTAKRAEGAGNVYEALIPVANNFGYAVSVEEINEFQKNQTGELSEEEMGKVSGASSVFGEAPVLLLSLNNSLHCGEIFMLQVKNGLQRTGNPVMYSQSERRIAAEPFRSTDFLMSAKRSFLRGSSYLSERQDGYSGDQYSR